MDTVILIPYFNFSRSPLRERALLRSLASIGDGVDVVLVAHQLGGARELLEGAPRLTIITVGAAARVWQKERLLNLALAYTRGRYDYIVWSDADIIFDDPSWPERVRAALANHLLVQGFAEVVDIAGDELAPRGPARRAAARLYERGELPASYFERSGVSRGLGCAPGFVWAARAELLARIDLPDFFILGSGDKAMFAAALGRDELYARALGLNASIRARYRAWAEDVYQLVRAELGCAAGTIFHSCQGEYAQRGYADRYALVSDERFVLDELLEVDEGGAWRWIHDNEFATAIAAYFEQRGD